jgi:hypothetical protein
LLLHKFLPYLASDVRGRAKAWPPGITI